MHFDLNFKNFGGSYFFVGLLVGTTDSSRSRLSILQGVLSRLAAVQALEAKHQLTMIRLFRLLLWIASETTFKSDLKNKCIHIFQKIKMELHVCSKSPSVKSKEEGIKIERGRENKTRAVDWCM